VAYVVARINAVLTSPHTPIRSLGDRNRIQELERTNQRLGQQLQDALERIVQMNPLDEFKRKFVPGSFDDGELVG